MTPEAAARDYALRMKYIILQVTAHDGQRVRVMKRTQSARRQARAAGFEVPPTPVLKRVRRRKLLPLYLALAALALVGVGGVLAFLHLAGR